jgi:hypothetical protein
LPDHLLFLGDGSDLGVWLNVDEGFGLHILGILEHLLHRLAADRLPLHLPVRQLGLNLNLLLSEILLLIIEFEVVKQFCARFVAAEDLKNLFANFWVNLLAVSSLASGPVLVVWVLNVDQLSVWQVFDLDPG